MRLETRIGLALTLIVLGSGCGTFENILPDREKEYKYSTEIPELEVPPDLSASAIESASLESSRFQDGTQSDASTSSRDSSAPGELPEVDTTEPLPDVEHSDGGAFIRVEENFSIAWRMVGRALSRLEIEVEDLNRSDGLYYIIFEDRRGKTSDDSIWSSLAFWSDANSIEEQRFRITVETKSETTEVRIMDEDGSVLSGGTGLDVLKMIQKEINEQIAEK